MVRLSVYLSVGPRVRDVTFFRERGANYEGDQALFLPYDQFKMNFEILKHS